MQKEWKINEEPNATIRVYSNEHLYYMDKDSSVNITNRSYCIFHYS